MVTKEVLDSDDNLFNLGIFSEQVEFYSLSKDLNVDGYYKETDMKGLLEVQFIQNTETMRHKRVIYGPLDFLGDFGGLQDALVSIGSLLISFL